MLWDKEVVEVQFISNSEQNSILKLQLAVRLVTVVLIFESHHMVILEQNGQDLVLAICLRLHPHRLSKVINLLLCNCLGILRFLAC